MESVPYSNVTGSLMYAMVCTRPDIAYAISLVSIFMSKHGKTHWAAVKWILRYIKATTSTGLIYGNLQNTEDGLVGYVDADYAADIDRIRSISGYTFMFNGCVVSWKATLQAIVALSTTEAEYVAITEAAKEGIWLKGILTELMRERVGVKVYTDSQSALHLTKNPMPHERTKHIDIRLHFIRDLVEQGKIDMQKISTEDNPADMLSNPVPIMKLQHFLNQMNIGETKVIP
ncbi:secreted RxLR effector protein 161-like [Henckelia pumila]|uniref:secreted RxLR effector protein 161-like n=1 Tax=Henckelia pumila TaxID=405737 RepID=UPI003C6DC12A